MLQSFYLIKSIKNKNYEIFFNNILLAFIFGILYYIIDNYYERGIIRITTHEKLSKDITFFDCMHFSFLNQTTNGFGDMLITTRLLKVMNLIHLILLLTINEYFL